eukprot:scpid72576/ scgid25188/ 
MWCQPSCRGRASCQWLPALRQAVQRVSQPVQPDVLPLHQAGLTAQAVRSVARVQDQRIVALGCVASVLSTRFFFEPSLTIQSKLRVDCIASVAQGHWLTQSFLVVVVHTQSSYWLTYFEVPVSSVVISVRLYF